jgi:hypothetical protein
MLSLNVQEAINLTTILIAATNCGVCTFVYLENSVNIKFIAENIAVKKTQHISVN